MRRILAGNKDLHYPGRQEHSTASVIGKEASDAELSKSSDSELDGEAEAGLRSDYSSSSEGVVQRNSAGSETRRLVPSDSVVSDISTFDMDSNDNFKVVIRVRPPVERELEGEKQFQNIVAVNTEANILTVSENIAAMSAAERAGNPGDAVIHPTHSFAFDHVYDQNTPQKHIYDNSAKAAVLSTLKGYNATIIAYGQTGTGKTYTMEGNSTPEGRGIIPRSIEDIFYFIENDTTARSKYLVRASYLQIYNEVISDLLKPERTNLTIREDKKKGVFVEGLSEWVVRSPAEIYGLMERGAAQRAVGSTNMNELSSRSHAVFIIIAENSVIKDVDQGAEKVADQEMAKTRQSFKVGKLNLVDLAGSERVRVTGATGKRLEESKKINQSLSCLGNVISALTESKGQRQHIPYRDSKLTRILEDSLGGNCKTTMMAMISPALESLSETLSTLKFANRAKNIKNEAKINEDLDQKTLLRKYERELKKLRDELQQRSRNLVDKRRLLELEEQKRRAEEDKLQAITELEARSKEFMNEKLEKQKLEERIQSMQSQLLIGGHKIEDTPAFRSLLQQEHKRIRTEYEQRLAELEKERHTVEEDKAQVDRYKQLLLKQRDIMIALTARLNERDDQIISLQEELEAYDRHQRKLEDALDQKTAELIHLRKAAMDFYASTPRNAGEKVINTQLMSALGVWGDNHEEKLAVQENWLADLDATGAGAAAMAARVEGFARALGLPGGETAERVTTFVRKEVEELRKKYSEVLGMMKIELRLSSERIVDDKEQIQGLKAEIEKLQKRLTSAEPRATSAQAGGEVEALREALREARREVAELRKERNAAEQGPAGEMESKLESVRLQYGQFRQDVTARLEEKNRQIKRLEEENQTLTGGGPSEQHVAALREQCRTHTKERTALMTILDSKVRTLVESIARTLGELPGEVADAHPARFAREVHALEKLVGATIQAMKGAEEAERAAR
ncbi:Kinesin-like protein [Klebsormidium nitens]|uniref:Kinesin-like protein n=1 Tax=Klebsormidium nitens TaxID=105231 RepID=A0A1Y1HLY9_KLENI|nr:Kinesin-like protein [Klebsormidium nitens]|eukprot:GAQ78682.1 Kinesin-like protein [Klebsormidium nitens]